MILQLKRRFFIKISQKICFFFGLILCLSISPVWAWDSTGHRLIAQIAYDHLHLKTREKVNRLSEMLNRFFPYSRGFVWGASWADGLKQDDVTAFNEWHYINTPYIRDGVSAPYLSSKNNVVWAILQSKQVLTSRKANRFEKALFLRFLTHFVGDAHQPLHCITLYSKRFPRGDAGGGFFPIKSRLADNLHQLWDRGLGFFGRFFRSYPLHSQQIKWLSKKIETDYPEQKFGRLAHELDPKLWAHESYLIAKKDAYALKVGSRPSKSYMLRGQAIVERRIALAGYRLANLLNADIF